MDFQRDGVSGGKVAAQRETKRKEREKKKAEERRKKP